MTGKKKHPFDEAIALKPLPEGRWQGHTSPAYGNMVGPFGGVTTAQALNAILQSKDRLGDPVSLTVNFCAALVEGPFEVQAHAARTNRSTQHWLIEMVQGGEVVMTGTAVTAVRRETWGVDEEPMPLCPAPQDVPKATGEPPIEFPKRYEMRPITGDMPAVWDGSGHSSLSQLWVRDFPQRALDFAALASLADIFFPRVFIRRTSFVPVGTVSMTIYFHAGSEQIAQTGSGFLLGQARAQAFRNGFFDQTSQLWNEAGVLLVTTHQIVYYKH